jgi:thiol-disulfide isomerase/thioredoxin
MRKKNMEAGRTYHFRVKPAVPGTTSNFEAPLIWTHPRSKDMPPLPSVFMEIMPTDVNLLSATIQWSAGSSPKYEVQYLLMDGVSDWITATDCASSTAIKKKNLQAQGSTPFAFRWRGWALDQWGDWSHVAGPIAPPVPATTLGRVLAPLLVSSMGNTVATPSLGGKVIGLYFSAHWCGPCRQFTPGLVNFYHQMRSLGRPFEVVFVSADRSDRDFQSYFHEMPWLAVPYESHERQALEEKHEIRGIPTLKILNSSGRVVDADARARPLTVQTFDNWYAQCMQG